MREFDDIYLKQDYQSRFIDFQKLMRFRIRDILLVSSLYDAFIIGEDGGLYEMLLNEYVELNLSHAPGLKRVSSGRDALREAQGSERYDLIITTPHLEDMSVLEFAANLRESGNNTALVLLSYDNRELKSFMNQPEIAHFDKVFLWQGNFRILLAIIKVIEDLRNVERDTRLGGVQSIILIEDSVKFYSSYLPIIYTQLMRHSQNVLEESVNVVHRMLRMRARSKILLCETFEKAWDLYEQYHESIQGVISDISFPRNGRPDPMAGVEFTRSVKARHPDIPVLLQSNKPDLGEIAGDVGASFLLKDSPRLLHELERFMKRYFNFGDFVFYLPDGREVGRAHNLRELQQRIREVPDECLLYHSERNHFSNWLKARTEFGLAHQLRPRKVSDYDSVDHLRQALIGYLRDYHASQHRGTIVDFDPEQFDGTDVFTRLGTGSMGGKGRGLVFAGTLLNRSKLASEYSNVSLGVPPSFILQTDIFDEFIESNDLGDFALNCMNDAEIVKRFVNSEFPLYAVELLRQLLRVIKYPVAVRSSSLLEDSQYQPFAGVYDTYMVPNNHQDIEIRLVELLSAVKRVYASVFSSRAKRYITATPYRLEEEKMGVIIQKLVGKRHRSHFYPDFSGVAQSHNFYPVEPIQSEDGVVSVALGLGATVVEGGLTIRFCPKYPKRILGWGDAQEALTCTQREFYALRLPEPDDRHNHLEASQLVKFGLKVAEEDGVLASMASTYSAQNNALYDGVSRGGMRVITFAPILKQNIFPLPEIMRDVIDLFRRGMTSPVEIEFSVNLNVPHGEPPEFRVLQLRPMVTTHERERLTIEDHEREQLVCRSSQVFGNGIIEGLQDVVLVDESKFERSNTVEIAQEIGLFNVELSQAHRPYLLVGIGRWGSADPWLGIPVNWDQIDAARVIIETGFTDMKVSPSQGTHFFQNLVAFGVGYFTVDRHHNSDFIDWDWLLSHEPLKERKYSRHLRFKEPIHVKMNGRTSEGIILKPPGST